MAGHPCRLHSVLHPPDDAFYAVRAVLGHQQQKFIAAVADQDIGLAQTALHGCGHGLQCFISHQMSKAVVDRLELVHIDHRHAAVHLAPGKELIKIAAGVGPGQGVYEGAALHAVAAVQQQPVAAHIQPAAIRQPGDQFQHTAPAAYLDILGNDKIGFLVLELDLIQNGLAGIGLGGNAVFAPGILVPYHVAVAGLFGQDAVTVQRKHLAVLRVYQTHHIKDALQPP